jgi:hypothetical protein
VSVTDRFGNPIEVGDFVAYATSAGSSSDLHIGRVRTINLNPKYGKPGDFGLSLHVVGRAWRGHVQVRKVTIQKGRNAVRYPMKLVSSEALNALLAHDPYEFPLVEREAEPGQWQVQFKGCIELTGYGRTVEEAHEQLYTAWRVQADLGSTLRFNGKVLAAGVAL